MRGTLQPGSMVIDFTAIDLLQTQLFHNIGYVCLIDQGRMGQFKFAFLRFLCEDMALVCVLPLDLTGGRKLKALFGTGFRF